jgi:hypothetical protein
MRGSEANVGKRPVVATTVASVLGQKKGMVHAVALPKGDAVFVVLQYASE